MPTISQKPILLAILEYGELPELLHTAESAQAALNVPVVFAFVKRSYRKLSEDTAILVAKGYKWIDFQGRLHDTAAPPNDIDHGNISVKTRLELSASGPMPMRPPGNVPWNRLLTVIFFPWFVAMELGRALYLSLRATGSETANLMRDIKRFQLRYRQLEKILIAVDPCLLVVGQDSPANELSFLLIAAGRLNIARLIVPFAMFSIHETAEYAISQRNHHADTSTLNRLTAHVFPHWVIRYRGQSLLRLPGYRALALELTGLIKGLPWTPLSEPAEAITANAAISAEALINLGVDPKRLHIVGSPMQDRLASHLINRSAIRQRLCQTYGLDPRKQLLVCGWPVNMFAWLAGRPIAYADYPAVTAAWATILSNVRDRHDINVIISVHPKTLPEETAAALAAGLPCQNVNADELVAVCDLFTTLNGSSITAWAIACGIPAVLYDCFLTRYPDFLNVAGCVNTEDEEFFSNTLHSLCGDKAALTALAAAQKEASAPWGKLDGLASERLKQLVKEIAGTTSDK